MIYYGQLKQDKLLDKYIFRKKKKGFFVDIGAHDGIANSNTYFFEKNRSWRGVCVEPRKKAFTKLLANRNCAREQWGVLGNSGKEIFVEIEGYCEQLSGIERLFSEKQKKRISNESKIHEGKIIKYEIDCISLEELLIKYNVKKIDYISIDTEGSEWDILKDFNFTKFKIGAVSVENVDHGDKIYRLFKKNGFKQIFNYDAEEIYAKTVIPQFLFDLFNSRILLFFRYRIARAKELLRYKRGNISKKYLKKILPSNPVIIEAGAHVGNDTMQMAKLWPNGYIFSLEPIPGLFNQLEANVSRFANVKIFDLALGVESKLENIFVSSGASDGSSSLLKPKEHLALHPDTVFEKKIKVRVIGFDDFIKKEKIKKVDLLWMDIQGFEYNVIKASKFFGQIVDNIYLEVSLVETYDNVVQYGRLKEFLCGKGYEVKREFLPWEDMGNVLFCKKV